MSQPTIDNGTVTYTLPYPQTLTTSEVLRSADFPSYSGTIRRDYKAGADTTIRYVQIGWSDLANTEMITINACWVAMTTDYASTWTYTGPNGGAFTAHIDPEAPNLAATRYAGLSGSVLYTARLNLILEL